MSLSAEERQKGIQPLTKDNYMYLVSCMERDD